MTITLQKIQYQPNGDAVSFFMVPVARGPGRAPFYLHTTQAALAAHDAGGAEVWGGPDHAALTEAQALLDRDYPGQGFVVVLPETEGVA